MEEGPFDREIRIKKRILMGLVAGLAAGIITDMRRPAEELQANSSTSSYLETRDPHKYSASEQKSIDPHHYIVRDN